MAIPGYKIISRRDRHENANRGGILTLARDDFNGLSHISNCEDEERSWHFMSLGAETILVGNWYRPGASVHDGFEKLQTELGAFSSQVSGIILSGDLNIHHRRWLFHSNADTPIGAEMKVLCDSYGLQQLVHEPTRNEYLLDLFLSDLPECRIKVVHAIADHKAILAEVLLPEMTEEKAMCRHS